MVDLASQQRFEEAADIRRRASALSTALRRKYLLDSIRSTGRLVVELPGVGVTIVERGRLAEHWSEHEASDISHDRLIDVAHKDEVDELWCVANWLNTQAEKLRLVHCDQPLSSRYPYLDDFRARNNQPTKRAS
jgi:hypothetical protein